MHSSRGCEMPTNISHTHFLRKDEDLRCLRRMAEQDCLGSIDELWSDVMRATIMYAAGDVRVANVPDAAIVEATDAVVRVTRACISGSALWAYRLMARTVSGQS